jgi:hypothetical protein
MALSFVDNWGETGTKFKFMQQSCGVLRFQKRLPCLKILRNLANKNKSSRLINIALIGWLRGHCVILGVV